MDQLRVLIADDNAAVREMIVKLLSSDFHVVGAVGDGQQLVEAAVLHQPHVIISDISMPLMDGFSARNGLLLRGIACPFIFITMDLEGVLVSADEGAVGYVHKTDLIDELKLAIREVAAGFVYVSQSFQKDEG